MKLINLLIKRIIAPEVNTASLNAFIIGSRLANWPQHCRMNIEYAISRVKSLMFRTKCISSTRVCGSWTGVCMSAPGGRLIIEIFRIGRASVVAWTTLVCDVRVASDAHARGLALPQTARPTARRLLATFAFWLRAYCKSNVGQWALCKMEISAWEAIALRSREIYMRMRDGESGDASPIARCYDLSVRV